MIDPAFKQEIAHHEHKRCKYPSKICRNVRTRKRNGQFHRFCEQHRTKANQNQKRWSTSRQRRWDALALQLRQYHDYQSLQFPLLAIDDTDCDYEFGLDATMPVGGVAPSEWQGEREWQEFLSDLLVAIAADDAVQAPPPASW